MSHLCDLAAAPLSQVLGAQCALSLVVRSSAIGNGLVAGATSASLDAPAAIVAS